MKLCLLFVAVFALVMSIDAQVVFYPNFARTPSIYAGLPGLVFSNDDDPYSSGNQNFEAQYVDTEGRGSVYADGAEAAEGRQGGDLLGTIGGDLNLNRVPNPFASFNKDLYRPRTKTVVIPPVCVACKCQVGFKTCADAGGRQWLSGECSAKPDLSHKAGDECSYAAPPSLSACDASCVKACPATADGTAPGISDCTVIDAVNKRQCTTPCENLARGSIIKCNSAYPDAISKLPGPCNYYHDRYRRHLNDSVPATKGSFETPEIQSSQDSPSDRSGRVLKIGLPLVTRVNVNPVTNFIRGLVTATYVAGDGSCLSDDLAAAPLCN